MTVHVTYITYLHTFTDHKLLVWHRSMSGVKSIWKRILKAAVVGEVVLVLASYRVWHKMNTDRDYRKWMNDTYPAILEAFYKTAELGGYKGAREADAEVWDK